MAKQCPANIVTLFFDANSTVSEQERFETHIAECSSCRQQLENNCGDPKFWTDLSTVVDDEYDSDWKTVGSAITSTNTQSEPNDNSKSDQSTANSKAIRLLETLTPMFGPTDDPDSAGRLGNYEVTGLIGSGGMGAVLKAREPALDRIVAIKVLLPHLATDEACRLRFEREAKAAAAIKHPGIIPIYRVDTYRDLPYFVMPFEVGPSLQQRIRDEGALSIEEALRVAAQISDALSAAEQTGLVHRDIKPSNILLAPGTERALLTDFGLAQTANDNSLTQTGMLAGTPVFMSPEQARGEFVDHRSDLFSLGSVLFCMLTGHPPVLEESTYKLVRQIGDGQMPRLNDEEKAFPEWLVLLVDQLHNRNPTLRIQTAAECTQLITKCLLHHQNPVENELPAVLLPRRQSANPNSFRMNMIWTTGCMLAIAITGYLGFQTLNTLPKKTEPSPNSTRVLKPETHEGGTSTTQKHIDPKTEPRADFGSDSVQSWNDGLDETVREIRERLSSFDD